MGKIRVAIAPVGERPHLAEIEDTLEGFQRVVGGHIEAFDVLWGCTPSLFVNEEGLMREDCPANRAVYASRSMVERGYLSQLDMGRVVEEGELYAILCGDILAVSYDTGADMERIARDITVEEFSEFCKTFEDPDSGWKAVMELRFGRAA